MSYLVQIISAGRPHRVEPMQELLGVPALWYVPKRDLKDYKAAGAEVVPAGKLCHSRNLALDHAHEEDQISVQLSDDLKSIKFYDGKDVDKKLPRAERFVTWTFKRALDYMVDSLHRHGFKLAGVAPNTNELNYKTEYQTRHFILGDWIVVLPSEQRFDTNITLKEDYDFTCQHIEAHGGALRCCGIIAAFDHRTNEGGAVAYRTPEEEFRNIRYIKKKWPNAFVKHRKETEMILRWRDG